jgi:uncharacterized protein
MNRQARLLLSALGLVFAAVAPAAAAETWRDKVTEFGIKNFNHIGFSHVQRDYALAKSLSASDHVTLDDDVIFAAAYLHDMGAFPAWAEPHKDHSDTSAAKIDLVLADTDFPKAKLDAVRAAIRTHMYYRDPVSPEARYLHDADALDWLGAIGVARMLELVDPNGGTPHGPDVVEYIQGNLKSAQGRVFTQAGKAQLAPRIAELKAFMDALAQETDGFKTF